MCNTTAAGVCPDPGRSFITDTIRAAVFGIQRPVNLDERHLRSYGPVHSPPHGFRPVLFREGDQSGIIVAEVHLVPLEDLRQGERFRLRVPPVLLCVGQVAPGVLGQLFPDVCRGVGFRNQRRTTQGGADQSEVDQGFLERRTDNGVLDVVQRDGPSGCGERLLVEESGHIQRLFDSRIVVDVLDDQSVVGVDPEGELFVGCHGGGIGRLQAFKKPGEFVASLERSVIDPAVGDVCLQQPVEDRRIVCRRFVIPRTDSCR